VTVACVIVNFNGVPDTLRAVESLTAQSRPPDWIIVVDNGSTMDESTQLQGTDAQSVVVLRKSVNLGFAAGCNEGIRYAQERGCRYIMVLNNDIWVESEALAWLVRALDSSSDSAACPLIVRMDNPDVVWAAGGEMNLRTAQLGHRLQGRPRAAARHRQQVDFASGCALMLKSEVFREVGLLPERWFLYFEDTEFCAQLQRAGRTIAYVPEAVVQHRGAASVARSDANYFFYWRNYLLFVREWMVGPARILGLFRIVITIAGMASFNTVAGRGTRARMLVLALAAAARGDWNNTSMQKRLR
jgi:GT2 family glycosyltransferase